MESEFSPDKETPPVPIKTYQWEDLRRSREAGKYPWTYLLKPPVEGEITAEDILRETTPRRSMSREFSRSRTHSPAFEEQKILNLDSSPGSSRKHGEEGEDEGVHIPNFSKEVSLDSVDDLITTAVDKYVNEHKEPQPTTHLATPIEIPKNVSPKSILKRRSPNNQFVTITETREKSKCCHPLVNKIKHLADKTLQKLEKSDIEKSPNARRKENKETQEIRQLKTSPGAVRRQKFSAIKLGDSDEMSKTLSVDVTPPSCRKKDHIYEDIDESKVFSEKSLHFAPDIDKLAIYKQNRESETKESDSIQEKKSNTSQDPSLVAEDNAELKPEEHIMEKLHKIDDTNKEAVILDDDVDNEEPNVDEIFQNQLDEVQQEDGSPNITITEIIDEVSEKVELQLPSNVTSSSPQNKETNMASEDWSKTSSDHEYEIIEKPSSNVLFPATNAEKVIMVKTDDELSSTTSLERKYLQHTSDEEEQADEKEIFSDEKAYDVLRAEELQKNIEERFFVSTPSTVSRTECEISTSQVDSSALENLPLKRGSRTKNAESIDSKIQQRIKEGTGKLKSQAGKLKTKLQNIKANMPDKPKLNFPERPKFKMPDRPKISFPERPKFSLPDRRKFSLPERPKLKKMNISEKLSLGDRKKFSFPDRPKFNVPDLSKFKLPDRPKINFSSLGRKKDKAEPSATGSNHDVRHITTVEYETKTYPRIFNRKKKVIERTSSSPTLEREDTPPPVFTFTRVKKTTEKVALRSDSLEQPREYGTLDTESCENKHFDETYDFDKTEGDYLEEGNDQPELQVNLNSTSETDITSPTQDYSHVINEINNDEFFVRPRGISRENIQVREYLSDEIRQAFKIPSNSLAMMGRTGGAVEHMYANDMEADPELLMDDNDEIRYSSENLNDKDDGYYTFPPIRPSRAKRKKKEVEDVKYIDESVNASIQFSDVDFGISRDRMDNIQLDKECNIEEPAYEEDIIKELKESKEKLNGNDYAYDEMIEYQAPQSQTLPMPPKRKKKRSKHDIVHSSYNDFPAISTEELWPKPKDLTDNIIVYRTEHEYIVPQTETVATEQSPLAPRRSRTRSRNSHGTSLYDDDRTSHGAESLTLDTHILPQPDEIEVKRSIRQESPGYATVDKGPHAVRRSKSKTPPVRRRKSNSSERKYYTVGPTKPVMPDRPPRKKSSTSLMALDNISKRSASGDITQYVEIDDPPMEELQKDLASGEVISKMKDRPLPPPPRPPRGSRRRKSNNSDPGRNISTESQQYLKHSVTDDVKPNEVIEIEVSTQTDPLPDDVDFELGMDENLDISMSSSLKDIIDDDHLNKSLNKLSESPRISRPTSSSEKSFKISDPKISELSKSSLGRTSPTVILVERRVSSPTRINEREEMLTEASLTVQHIDVDESKIPDVPPLPTPRAGGTSKSKTTSQSSDERALEKLAPTSRDIHLDNLITQKLQVRDLDVGRLNVSELQASKILVSDIEGMTLQVTELDSKTGHISVSGIEFSQNVIDEIVKKFTELSAATSPPSHSDVIEQHVRPVSCEEETQTDKELVEPTETVVPQEQEKPVPSPPPRQVVDEDRSLPPQRPPPPDLTPLLYTYLQDMSLPPSSLYHMRAPRERPFTEFHESQHQSPPSTTRRVKRKLATPHSESSSDDERPRPSPRRMPPPIKSQEPTVTEAGAQFLRVCHNSISRTIRNIFNSFMSYISGTEDKRDVQMALVIFLVLIAGLIMFGLSDSRTIHHHHWEFFNPPDGKP